MWDTEGSSELDLTALEDLYEFLCRPRVCIGYQDSALKWEDEMLVA